ncbi:MAG TPA: tRNA (adenosine(37)-N6)-threonylcarbamoyltransferase complex ATPase subunit type 1 TsaE [Candidatus Margulisiibacteriota bacterium]|nr:tRNA (adenosine(37)-N6)-threonylcarbamoyltransferase complex ATPase subunit type 1 TsaE [Candidatus Margulisiibacteriota bacterium]
MDIISHSVGDTLKIGKAIAAQLKGSEIICLFGEFGSGKTILTKGIAKGLDITKEAVLSPSFVLIREHPGGRLPLYHFDLYRLKGEADIALLGYEEYLYGKGISVIEWAERLNKLLPREYLKVELFIRGKNERRIKFSAFGPQYDVVLKAAHSLIRNKA